MLVIPAIDIRHGQCVRLHQGRDHEQTVYGKDPVAIAHSWKEHGASMLHVADLDGAFDGTPVNLSMVARMRKETGLPVQVGGGYRDLKTIEAAIKAGIDRVILGTIAVQNPDLVREAAKRFGKQVTVSIDVKDEFVAVAGWTEISKMKFQDLIRAMLDAGIQELLFTDTRKDGTLSGPNIEAIKLFLETAKVPVIASGGVTTVRDLRLLKTLEPLGLKGAVIGKALYDERIRLEDAIQAVH